MLNSSALKRIYKERSYRVEPMLGNNSNRWLFAAMEIAIQMHQLTAFKEKRSTWKIKDEVLG